MAVARTRWRTRIARPTPFRTSTAAYAKKFADNNPVVRQQVTLPNVIAIPGGVPIKVGDNVIGGVGLSGSPGVDEPCVLAGLEKVADQLKYRCVAPLVARGDRCGAGTLWCAKAVTACWVAARTGACDTPH